MSQRCQRRYNHARPTILHRHSAHSNGVSDVSFVQKTAPKPGQQRVEQVAGKLAEEKATTESAVAEEVTACHFWLPKNIPLAQDSVDTN